MVTLGGITKPKGIVYDELADDWIMFGEVTEGTGTGLTMEDWTTALWARSSTTEDPGVSIDPAPVVFTHAGYSSVQTSSQNIRFFGPLRDTHFGQTCFEADWLLKRISFGLEGSSVFGPTELPISEFLGSVTTRYWLEPETELRVFTPSKLIVIQELKISVHSEILSAEDMDLCRPCRFS